MTARFPAIDELIPHRGLMALLVEVTARRGPDGLVCRGRIAAGHPFAGAAGGAPALLAIEMGAQAAGAFEGLRRAETPATADPPEPPPAGYLVGLREVRLYEPWLPVETDFEVAVRAAGSARPLSRYRISVVARCGRRWRTYARGEISTYILPRSER